MFRGMLRAKAERLADPSASRNACLLKRPLLRPSPPIHPLRTRHQRNRSLPAEEQTRLVNCLQQGRRYRRCLGTFLLPPSKSQARKAGCDLAVANLGLAPISVYIKFNEDTHAFRLSFGWLLSNVFQAAAVHSTRQLRTRLSGASAARKRMSCSFGIAIPHYPASPLVLSAFAMSAASHLNYGLGIIPRTRTGATTTAVNGSNWLGVLEPAASTLREHLGCPAHPALPPSEDPLICKNATSPDCSHRTHRGALGRRTPRAHRGAGRQARTGIADHRPDRKSVV